MASDYYELTNPAGDGGHALPIDDALRAALAEALGHKVYANQVSANADEDIGTIYYDIALARLNTVTN